jgi:choice-of-anchor A domain-containing protein
MDVDFAAEGQRLRLLSDTLAGYTANGSVYVPPWGGQYTLTGTDSALSVFNLSGDLLARTNTMTINLAPGSIALINVDGTADSFSNAGISINGGDASDILWNFHSATTLSFSGISMLGSVLAPSADYQGGWGQLNGQLIVKSLTDARGATQINNVHFSGGLLAPSRGGDFGEGDGVPEPATWILMIAGFGGVGAVLRRRNRLARQRLAAT